jgi:hypothetical protein
MDSTNSISSGDVIFSALRTALSILSKPVSFTTSAFISGFASLF